MISSKPYLFRAVYQWLLDCELTPYVMVDAMQPHVQVPEEHIEDGQIILDMTLSAVMDLDMNNDCVEFKARFSGVTRHIVLPMNSILALYAYENGRGMVFSDEDDDEKAIVGDNSDDGDDDDSPPPSGSGTGKRSHLKIVK